MSIRVNSLSISYGNKLILNSLSQEFLPGEVSIIAGSNGAGKSTLVKAIMNLIPVKKNSVFMNKKDIHSYSAIDRAKHIGYVAQFMNSDFDFSVYEIVEMGRYPYKKSWDRIKDFKYINRALELTDTKDLAARSISTLSGGELQRVLLARALAVNPDHLVLDEPSSNLDIKHNIDIMKLIKKLTKELNITTIMVLHDLNTMLHYGDKLVMLKNGEIIISGKMSDVLNPENINYAYGINSTIISDDNNNKYIVTV